MAFRLRVLAFLGLAGCSLVTSLDGLSEPDHASAPPDASVGRSAIDDAGTDTPADDARPDAPADAPKTITWHGTSAATFNDVGATSFAVNRPVGAVAGDLLVAGVALGNSDNVTLPVFSPPAGFTLVRRVDHGTFTSLLVYTHVATGSEPAMYAFTSDLPAEGQVWVSAYGSVDTGKPIDIELGVHVATSSTQYATPQITASASRGLVVAAFASRGAAGAWTPPSATTPRANLANTTSRSSLAIDIARVAPGVVAPMTASLPAAQEYGLTHVMVLRPAP
jgi:hypothetical protein